jgi:hypothetical protein
MISFINYIKNKLNKNQDEYKKLSDDNIKNLKTGDVLLFSGTSYISDAIKYCSKSNYSHVGIVLKDCTYIDPTMMGTYFIESDFDTIPDVEEDTVKFGVMVHTLEHVLRRSKLDNTKIFIRKLVNFDTESDQVKKRISDIYLKYRDIPYDINPTDWLLAKEACDSTSVEEFTIKNKISQSEIHKKSALWCSAFVGLFYTKLGVLAKTTPWALLSPKSFSFISEDLVFDRDYYLSPDEEFEFVV